MWAHRSRRELRPDRDTEGELVSPTTTTETHRTLRPSVLRKVDDEVEELCTRVLYWAAPWVDGPDSST